MKIGIVGAGNIGATLTRKLAADGHEVRLANTKGPDTIRDLASDVGAIAVPKDDAVQGVSVIVLSIPFVDFGFNVRLETFLAMFRFHLGPESSLSPN